MRAPLLLLSFLALLLNSCGVSNAIVLNANQNTTVVELGEANFRNVGKVSGQAEARYVFLIGGLKKRQLYNNAYAAMLDQAELTSGPRTVVNVVTEEHFRGFAPFYIKRVITVSGMVVEFTK
jgi:hypothetical protein